MKIGKVCPKCNSKNIVNIKHSHASKISIGFTGKARIAKYVCTDCGFIEDWVEYPVDLERIKHEYGEK